MMMIGSRRSSLEAAEASEVGSPEEVSEEEVSVEEVPEEDGKSYIINMV
jgi:hypothetical protein